MSARLECGECNNFVPDYFPPYISKKGRRGSCSDESTGVKETFTHSTPIDAAISNGVFTGTMAPIREVLGRIFCFKKHHSDTGIHEKRVISCIVQKVAITKP